MEKKDWSETLMMKARLMDFMLIWGSKGGEMSPTEGGVLRLDGGVLVDVGDCDHKQLAIMGFGLGSIEGEKYDFEACEGW